MKSILADDDYVPFVSASSLVGETFYVLSSEETSGRYGDCYTYTIAHNDSLCRMSLGHSAQRSRLHTYLQNGTRYGPCSLEKVPTSNGNPYYRFIDV